MTQADHAQHIYALLVALHGPDKPGEHAAIARKAAADYARTDFGENPETGYATLDKPQGNADGQKKGYGFTES